jgi:hypothetical protein
VWTNFPYHIQSSRFGFQETSHILDTKNVNTLGNELVDKVKVVLEGILGLLGVGNITAVADYSFANTTGFLGSVDTQFHLAVIGHLG